MAKAATVTNLKDATAAKKQATQGFSIDDVLASATVKKESKSTSKTPVMEVDSQTQAMAQRLRVLKDTIDSNTTEYDALSQDFVAAIDPKREDLINRQGYVSSLKVPDGQGLSVGITFSSSYSKIPIEAQPSIEEIIGERFDEFFIRPMEITVKKDVTDEALKDLIQSVGPERFALFFDVARWLKPNERYTKEFYTAFTAPERESLRLHVKQYKPSIKVR